ncbi:MAG: hypothetical protein P8Z37_19390 [Acidobacteriota bacterium]
MKINDGAGGAFTAECLGDLFIDKPFRSYDNVGVADPFKQEIFQTAPNGPASSNKKDCDKSNGWFS